MSCRKVFQVDLRLFIETDGNCPHCSVIYNVPAITPESRIYEEAKREFEIGLMDFIEERLPDEKTS